MSPYSNHHNVYSGLKYVGQTQNGTDIIMNGRNKTLKLSANGTSIVFAVAVFVRYLGRAYKHVQCVMLIMQIFAIL